MSRNPTSHQSPPRDSTNNQQRHQISSVFVSMKRLVANTMAVVDVISYRTGAWLAKVVSPAARKIKLEGQALRLRCADVVLVISIAALVAFSLWQFETPSWPGYVPQFIWIAVVAVINVTFVIVLVGRLLAQAERRRLLHGLLTRNDPRRHFCDSYICSEATAYVISALAWMTTTVAATYMLVRSVYGLPVSVVDIVVGLAANDFSSSYLAYASSFTLPGMMANLPGLMQTFVSCLLVSGVWQHYRIENDVRAILKEIFDDNPLQPDRESSLIGTMAGAPAKWKRPVMQVALDRGEKALLRHRAIELCRSMELASFAGLFLYSLQAESDESIKLHGLTVIKYLYLNSPEIFPRYVRQKHQNHINHQIHRQRRAHGRSTRQALVELGFVIERSLQREGKPKQ